MASIMNLHLQYRLWISDMNGDINVLRIFDDYIKDCRTKAKDENANAQLNKYQDCFTDIRKELDEVRHELYLNKMKLGAKEKAGDESNDDFEESIHHDDCKKRYEAFKAKFKELKKEFKKFEV